jgi:hypothetical protein
VADASQIELSPGVGGALTDAESVDTGTGAAGNTAPIQREVVVIGGLGDQNGLNGRAIKLQLQLVNGQYQLPVYDPIGQQLLDGLLLESRRQTDLLKLILSEIAGPRTGYFQGSDLGSDIDDASVGRGA